MRQAPLTRAHGTSSTGDASKKSSRAPRSSVLTAPFNNAFAYNDKAFYAGADLTFITADVAADIDLFYLLGLLNSSLIYTWFYHRGKRKGNMLELKAVPVSEVPIARDAKLEKTIAEIAKKAYVKLTENPDADIAELNAKLDELIYELYGLTPETEAVRDFANSKASIRKLGTPAADAEPA